MDAPKLAVYASHSALQIITGGRREGLNVTLFGPAERLTFYRRFRALQMSTLECTNEDCIEKLNSLSDHVVVPNGSLVEYVGAKNVLELKTPLIGSKGLLWIESRWNRKMNLLMDAGLPVPKWFSRPEEVDRLVIVKLPGAKGGRGYILTDSPGEINESLREYVRKGIISDASEAYIQEYVVGIPVYAHYFMSPIMNRLEITGFDVRYETNVDGLRRLSHRRAAEIKPSFVVGGNFPVYLRESLIETYIECGERFVEATGRYLGKPVVGPFCLESVVTEDLTPVFFEFSGRIVAGTNVYMDGSPYLEFYWGERMNVGQRIAREVRLAAEQGRIDEVVT
ncbi:MAG: formate--phosphoribosylaminoimidazolecarboxamide ligase [Aigarchaeota archaeon]|nr:formate--phosphoribosylaminoimidazolecarboxamide ligase [Aigarchaeota archaeon]MDW8092270.1 formate--phosphoribosylaminoimidazolecarboxamide ligase [Nitrososphaerota archaeon]